MTTPFTDLYGGGRTSPKMHYQDERGYMELLSDLFNFGCDTPDRTGVGRRKLFSVTQRYDLRKSHPCPTVRPTPLKIAFEEFWAFLNGRVDIHSYLSQKGITIWEGNTTREFLDGRGLHYLPVGHQGKAYGFQYRNFNGDYDENYMPTGGVDQIKGIYEELMNNAYSSRMVATIWNPSQEKDMALPPCWWNHQFIVTNTPQGDKLLNLQVTGRSNDVLFGSPFNIQQFGTYLACMAKLTGMVAGELFIMQVDAHIYGKMDDLSRDTSENHEASQIKYVAETLGREINENPVKLHIKKDLQSLDDMLSLSFEDLSLEGLEVNKSKYKEPRPKMAV
jgi:thymidylate synthase